MDTLRDWQKVVVRRRTQKGLSAHHQHVTRMFPKRADDLLDGGSIYWVIKGLIQCRNVIVGLEETRTQDGRKACAIVMDPKIIPVIPTPKRPFQGWRYLKAEDAPGDLADVGDALNLPPHLRAKLVDLGAW